MSPIPDPSATTPTADINATTIPAHVNFAQRAVRSTDMDWRVWERALVMLWSIALLCGLTWAVGLMCGLKSTPARAAGPVPVYVGGDLNGRWAGQPMGYLDPAKVCGSKGCDLTLDIVRCGDYWCGIRVEKSNECGGVALNLTPPKVVDPKVTPIVLNGKLELAEGTQPYVIEAVLGALLDGEPTQLTMVGDTGPELMMMRRSFPFRTVMARTGEAVCKLDKPAA